MSDIIQGLLSRVQAAHRALSEGSALRRILEKRTDEILEMQYVQLAQGKASSGKDMRPYYSEDVGIGGYFQSRAAAEAYKTWKLSVFNPYGSDRKADAPNLYIDGTFYSHLRVAVSNSEILVYGGTSKASGIIAKYGVESFGLTDENWNVLFHERGVLNELQNEINNIIYGTSV